MILERYHEIKTSQTDAKQEEKNNPVIDDLIEQNSPVMENEKERSIE